MRRLAAPLCVAALVLLYWVAAWTSVATLLTRESDAQIAIWERGATPWEWNFSFSDTIVWPGSSGFTRTGRLGPLVGRLPTGNGDLSLQLWGRGIDLSLIDHALIRAHPNSPMQAQIFAHIGGTPVVLGEAPLVDRDRPTTIPIVNGEVADALRLHLNGAERSSITLRFLGLVPKAGVAPQLCEATSLTGCNARIPVVSGADGVTPESLLFWRDALLRERPAAIVLAPDDVPSATSLAAALRVALKGPLAWLLIVLPLIGLIASHVVRTPPTRTRAALELGAVFVPWLILQWIGVDPDDVWTPRAFFAYWCAFAAAVLIRNPTPDWRFVGAMHAWRAIGQFALLALALVAATGLANAIDADGFVLRPPEEEMYWRYPVWALVQQWIILRAIAPRMRVLFPSELAAAIAVGALFGLLHVPNFTLMLLTFAAGGCWAWIGYRHRALLPLALSHALLGLALFTLAPPWLLRSAEVGARFLVAP